MKTFLSILLVGMSVAIAQPTIAFRVVVESNLQPTNDLWTGMAASNFTCAHVLRGSATTVFVGSNGWIDQCYVTMLRCPVASLEWSTQTNKCYMPEYTTNLSNKNGWTNWNMVFPGNGSNVCYVDSVDGQQKYYRIKLWQ